jgi:hypothetical protein
MRPGKRDYQRYLQSPEWQATRERRLKAAGHRCEFQPEVGEHKGGPIYGDRCEAMTGLDVHHQTYDRQGSETDADLEVLCRLHHLVRHAMDVGDCELCGDTVTVDEDAIIAMIETAVGDAGGVEKVTFDDLDIPTVCDHCNHVMDSD